MVRRPLGADRYGLVGSDVRLVTAGAWTSRIYAVRSPRSSTMRSASAKAFQRVASPNRICLRFPGEPQAQRWGGLTLR